MTGYSIKVRLKTEKQNYLTAHSWYLLIYTNNLCFSYFYFVRTAIYLETDTFNYFSVCVVGAGEEKEESARVHKRAFNPSENSVTLLKCLYFH